jgi:drug/metabolite transporter (DMT)-like permease
MKRKTLLADLGLFYAAFIWGSTFIIVKSSVESFSPVLLVGLRFTLAAIFMLFPILILKKKLFSNIKQGLILGFFLWLLYISQTIGLKYTSASNSGFITGLFILFVPILGFLFFRIHPRINKLIAVIVSLIGLWILTGGIVNMNLGDLLTLLTAFAYAMQLLFADRLSKRNMDPYTLNFQQFLVTGVLSLVISIFQGFSFSVDNSKVLFSIIFLAIFPTFSAFLIQLKAQKFTSPTKVALIFALEPVFAAIFAWTFGNEEFIWTKAVGGLLIFLGMILSEIKFSRRELACQFPVKK